MKEQTLFKKNTLFVEVLSTLQKNVSKRSDRKRKNLVRLVIWTTDERDVRHSNVLDVDLKITKLKNIQSHQNRTRDGEIKYILMEKVIVHATRVKITVTKRYMHLWHVCLVMMNILVEIW